MATTNYNLPTITGNMTADVVRDMNALAEATDAAVKQAVDTHNGESASTTKKGHVQLSDSTTSTSTSLAATANAVKKVSDAATAKYTKPSAGIPKTDMASDVQASLGKADTALQSVAAASTTQAGVVQLEDSVSSPSVDTAATANAVKKVSDSLTTHLADYAHIKISDNAPANLNVGNLWFDLGETNESEGGGEGTFVFGNGVVSDGEPGDTEAIWLDYD